MNDADISLSSKLGRLFDSSTPFVQSVNLSAMEILTGLVLSFLFSMCLIKIYLRYYKGFGQPKTFATSLILVTMVTSTVMMIISGNLALSLGMVGALSIIRYRTAVKSNRDLAYLFWAISIGLGCGAGNYKVPLISVLFISLVIMLIERYNAFFEVGDEYILMAEINHEAGKDDIVQILPKVIHLKSSLFKKETGKEEVTYSIIIRDQAQLQLLNKSLKELETVDHYHLLAPNYEALGA